MVKLDPYHSQINFEKWLKKIEKTGRIEGINYIHSKLIIHYIKDMALGINISKVSKKGARSFIRLHTMRLRLVYLFKLLEKRKVKDITKVTPQILHKLFTDMREGIITTRTGKPFKSTRDYVKNFKAFWHWHQRVMKNKGEIIQDVCEDLDTRGEKPKFVYFTDKDCEKLIKEADYDLKPLLALAFDSGARNSELVNIKVSDFSNDFMELNIREETSKTFGRKIKLMLCSEQIKKYVKKMDLKLDDYLITKSLPMINRGLRKIGKEVLTTEQIKFKNLSLYDFRHSSACFWLPKYKSESALKYRFGWKRSDMIHYYTEFLGMEDTIKAEDMYDDLTKSQLEKENEHLKIEIERVKKGLDIIEKKMGLVIQQAEKHR